MNKTLENYSVDSMVLALVAGDDLAWAELKEMPWYKYAYNQMRTNKDIDVDDLMQDILTDLYLTLQKYVETGRPITSLKALFDTIFVRTKNSYLKKIYRRRGIAQFDSLVDYENVLPQKDEYEDIEDYMEFIAILPVVYQAIQAANLKAEDLTIINYSYAYERSDKDIAEELNKSVNTIKSKRQRAMAKIRSQIEKSGSA